VSHPSTSKCVIVLGPHRGGTSAVAGVLHRLGVNMGDRLLPADKGNQQGYYEDEEFLNLHQRLLREDVDSFDEWIAPPPEPWPVDLEAYEALIKRKAEQPLWGVKDPRLCYLLPTFLQFVPGEDVWLVKTLRDPMAITASLRDRERLYGRRMDPNVARSVATSYTLAATICTSEFAKKYGISNVIYVDYDALVEQPKYQVYRLAHKLGLQPNDSAVRHVNPKLRRH